MNCVSGGLKNKVFADPIQLCISGGRPKNGKNGPADGSGNSGFFAAFRVRKAARLVGGGLNISLVCTRKIGKRRQEMEQKTGDRALFTPMPPLRIRKSTSRRGDSFVCTNQNGKWGGGGGTKDRHPRLCPEDLDRRPVFGENSPQFLRT